VIHANRIFGVEQISNIETLAHLLFHYTWANCAGYQLGQYLFLNDSFGPDGAQEYAVFRISDDQFVQIESITVSWCYSEPLLEAILSRAMKSQLFLKSYRLKIEDAATHHCHYCT
jgi:hypothetical protein